MSKKLKLIERLREKPKNFTWDEAGKLMGSCGFVLRKQSGSARMFVHTTTRVKVRLHEPHPEKTLLPYMLDRLIEGLLAAGEIEE